MRLYFGKCLFVMLLFSAVAGQAGEHQIKIGWLEKVTIGTPGFSLLAKIDTGADNSSINAGKAKLYTKGNNQWVKFTLKNSAGREITIDKPILKTTRIKAKRGGSQQRFVIELEICLGSIQKRTEVNLIDRSHYRKQLLIGRSFLSPDYLVDASQTYLTQPQCE